METPKFWKFLLVVAVFVAAGGALLAVTDTPESQLRAEFDRSFGLRQQVQPGNRIDAVGDSITLGHELHFTVDRFGFARKSSIVFQGWPGLLTEMLTEDAGSRIVVSNFGYGGDRSKDYLVKRLPGILRSQYGASRAIVSLGTNDSSDFAPSRPGRNCTGIDCGESYKRNMQQIIGELRNAGREMIYVGTLPPVWGPKSRVKEPYADPFDLAEASRNSRIVEYNEVIVGDLWALPGVAEGPDFYSCFLTPTINRFSLFKDNLHPNTLGHVFIAALWRDVIIGASAQGPKESCSPPVFILESLDPYAHGHKQNLLVEGDRYYNDESFILTSIPSELASGIWVTQANSDNANRGEDFLTFDVGQKPVTVYIAFDPAGSPPRSSSHEFAPTTLSSSLTVSDPEVGVFNFVKAEQVTGTVNIGGNKSGSGAASQQAYVVVVVP